MDPKRPFYCNLQKWHTEPFKASYVISQPDDPATDSTVSLTSCEPTTTATASTPPGSLMQPLVEVQDEKKKKKKKKEEEEEETPPVAGSPAASAQSLAYSGNDQQTAIPDIESNVSLPSCERTTAANASSPPGSLMQPLVEDQDEKKNKKEKKKKKKKKEKKTPPMAGSSPASAVANSAQQQLDIPLAVPNSGVDPLSALSATSADQEDPPANVHTPDSVPSSEGVQRGAVPIILDSNVSSPKSSYKTKNIWFRGLRKKIVLQDQSGPCSLIAICNLLVLRGELTLSTDLVSGQYLCHAVYHKLFPDLKEEEVDPIRDEVIKLEKGLNLSVTFGSTKGFEDSNGCKIFRILQIQLYHGWVLHPEEDEHIIKAIGPRSYEQVTLDLGFYQCALEAGDSSDPGIMDPQQYETISKFLSRGQLTNFGLSSLRKDMAENELAVFFHNDHFSTIWKHKGNIDSLVTDEGLSAHYDWQRLDSITGDDTFISSNFGSSNRGLDMSRGYIDTKLDKVLRTSHKSTRAHYQGSHSARPYRQGPQSSRSHQQGPKPTKPHEPGSKLTNAFQQQREPQHYPPRIAEPKSQPAISAAPSSSSSREAPLTSARTSPSDLQGKQYAALFTQDQDKKLGERFLAFLKGYKLKNGIPYYKGAVAAMNVHEVAEIYVQYGHIKHHDPGLAHSISCCFHRVQEHINNAAGTFMRDFKEFDFKFDNPTVFISDLPKPRRWTTLKEFFGLPGNQPAVDYDIHCGDVSFRVTKSTLIGRVACSNFLVKIGKTHNSGCSWDGTFSPDNVMINENLEADIWMPMIPYCTADSQQNDYARAADVLKLCEVDGRLPGFFSHLRSSLRKFIAPDRYTNTMVRNFQRFVTTHMALRPPMANLNFIDDIYAIHQTLSPRAKRLLRAILNHQILPHDWRSIFIGDEIPPDVPHILKSVYEFNKHSGEGSEEADTIDEEENSEAANIDEEEDSINEKKDREPFDGDMEGMMIYTRHAGQHGSKGSKDMKKRQSLKKLSELVMVISHFLDCYPAVMEQLICDIDTTTGEDDPVALEELKEMLGEILEDYNRAESSYLQFIDGIEINWMEYAEADC